jgi:hypothetical protein
MCGNFFQRLLHGWVLGTGKNVNTMMGFHNVVLPGIFVSLQHILAERMGSLLGQDCVHNGRPVKTNSIGLLFRRKEGFQQEIMEFGCGSSTRLAPFSFVTFQLFGGSIDIMKVCQTGCDGRQHQNNVRHQKRPTQSLEIIILGGF